MAQDRAINVSFLLSFGVHAAVFLLFSFVIALDFGSVASFMEVTYTGYAGRMASSASTMPMKLSIKKPLLINLPDRVFAVESVASAAAGASSSLPVSGEKVGLIQDYNRNGPGPDTFDISEQPGEYVSAMSLAMHEKYSVEGNLSSRKIILKPPSLEYPKWAVNSGIESDIKLRVTVNQHGVVERVESVQSTGYLKMDLVASEYIKQWRFESKALDAESESGIVSIKLKLK